MIDQDTAQKIAEHAIKYQGYHNWVFEKIFEKTFGWVFIYNNKKYIEEGNPNYARYTTPLIVDRCDGTVQGTGTAMPGLLIQKYAEIRNQTYCLERQYNDRLSYLIGGIGEFFLFIHGMPGSSFSWSWIGTCISEHFRVIIPDLIGHGESAALEEKEYDNYIDVQVEEISSLLRNLGIDSLYIACHDIGVAIVGRLIEANPQLRIKGLILCAVNIVDPLTVFPAWSRKLLESPWSNQIIKRRLGTPDGLYSLVASSRKWAFLFWVNFTRHLSAKSLSTNYQVGKFLVKHKQEVYQSVIGVLAGLQVPTLIMWGTEDHIAPAGIAVQIRKQIPTATLNIYDGGHFLHEEHPQRFVEEIKSFLS